MCEHCVFYISTGSVALKYERSCKYFYCGKESFCANNLLEYCQSNCRLKNACPEGKDCLQPRLNDRKQCLK